MPNDPKMIDAMRAWVDGVFRIPDPINRPGIKEAFEAGWKACVKAQDDARTGDGGATNQP